MVPAPPIPASFLVYSQYVLYVKFGLARVLQCSPCQIRIPAFEAGAWVFVRWVILAYPNCILLQWAHMGTMYQRDEAEHQMYLFKSFDWVTSGSSLVTFNPQIFPISAMSSTALEVGHILWSTAKICQANEGKHLSNARGQCHAVSPGTVEQKMLWLHDAACSAGLTATFSVHFPMALLLLMEHGPENPLWSAPANGHNSKGPRELALIEASRAEFKRVQYI